MELKIQLIYVAVTILFILAGMSRGGFTLWEPLPDSFNEWFGHHLFYYTIGCYDIVIVEILFYSKILSL